jgi:uncharacterized protein
LGAVGRVGALQLDAINVLERTQFLTLFARVGAYDRSVLHTLTGPGGRLYETPGFLAELVPMEHQPLFRPGVPRAHSMDTPRRRELLAAYLDANRAYIRAVRKEVEVRGPLTAAQLDDPRPREGTWWGRRSDGRRALEYLFRRGELSAWRAPSFERVYDLTARVVPPALLATPTPPVEEAHRRLLLLAAASLGVATAGDLAAYHLLRPQQAAPRVAELVASGALLPVQVEGWRDVAYVLPEAKPRRPDRSHATVLPPFDPIRRGHRSRLARSFGFDHRIEVYVPAPQRRYGYYVCPVLLDDGLVARVDLSADRRHGALHVHGAWAEPGHAPSDVALPLARELGSLRGWLGVDDLVLSRNGDLARALATA